MTKLPVVKHLDRTGLRYWELPGCEHKRINNPNTSYAKLQLCKLKATWDVDGMLLCTQHAGCKVLPVLVTITITNTITKDQGPNGKENNEQEHGSSHLD